jgi:dehydrodolichyl diphosphate syntase complex subunit NUS1
LKKDHKKLYAEVEKRRDQTINVVWPDSVYKQQLQSADSSKEINVSAHPHSKQHSIAVNFLCENDGKPSIGALCQQLGYGFQNGLIRSSDDITIDLIDQKLNEKMNKLPDPEVAIYFGNVCSTYGLLPWQIRLTEFISIKSQNSLRLKHFLNVLFIYAKCEQRLGK